MSGNWTFKSPTCIGGGGSRSDAKDVDRMSFSGSVKLPLPLEFFQGIEDMDEDIRLNILVVRDSFFSFLSSFFSSPSWLWTDLVSLIRRPKLLHVLSEDVREGAWLCSRECDDEVSREAGGSCFT